MDTGANRFSSAVHQRRPDAHRDLRDGVELEPPLEHCPTRHPPPSNRRAHGCSSPKESVIAGPVVDGFANRSRRGNRP